MGLASGRLAAAEPVLRRLLNPMLSTSHLPKTLTALYVSSKSLQRVILPS